MKSEKANQEVSVELARAMMIRKSEKKSKNEDSSMNNASKTGSKLRLPFLPAYTLLKSTILSSLILDSFFVSFFVKNVLKT